MRSKQQTAVAWKSKSCLFVSYTDLNKFKLRLSLASKFEEKTCFQHFSSSNVKTAHRSSTVYKFSKQDMIG